MNRKTFKDFATDALTEVLDDLGYPRANREKLCGLDFFPPPQDRDDTEYCVDYADGREGYHRICLGSDLADELARVELKRQLFEHGVVPGVTYVRPST